MSAVDAAEARLAPLEEAANTAHWALATDATDEHAQQAAEAQIAYEEALSDPALRADAAAAAEAATDPVERRRADVLHLAATAHQRPAALRDRIVALETELQGRFSGRRAVVGGREVTDNEIAAILLRSTDIAERREAWLAQRGVGDVVADDLLELIALRNQAAQALGHRDHYAFSLAMEELDEGWLYALLDDLERDLSGIWTAEKAAIDADVRGRLGLAADAVLQPWHYADPFFQDPPPPTDDPLLDAVADVDALAAARAYFASLGHDVDADPRALRSRAAARQGPARVPDHGRPRLRHPHALQPGADAALARDAAARARSRDLRRQRRQVAAVAAAHPLAHVHHRGRRDAARTPRARPRLPREVRRRRPRRRAAPGQHRRRAPRPADVRGVGAGDGAVRALALRRSRARTS